MRVARSWWGRVVRADADGVHRTTFAYDENGRLTTITDALAHSTHFAYNARGEVIADKYEVVDQLDVDVLVATKHCQARTLGSARNLLPDPGVPLTTLFARSFHLDVFPAFFRMTSPA